MPRKRIMTYAEMARSFERISGGVANKTVVGRFAKIIGYRVHKPMINGRVRFFYVKGRLKSVESEVDIVSNDLSAQNNSINSDPDDDLIY